MITTWWKCIQSSYVSYLPVYNSYYRERTGKKRNGAFLTTLSNWLAGLPHNRKLRQESGELCSLYNSNPAKLADVWCLELCAATLFVPSLKFGAVLSIIFGLLMAVSCWRHILPIYYTFLMLLTICKLAVCKLDLSRGGSYSVSCCVRP